MSVYISGSMAYDRIMNFPGVFSDAILPEKIHILNVCFLVDRLQENLGGCAGNIAYSLALLGENGIIVSSVGRDFARYAEELTALGLSLEGITRYDEEFTPGAYIITDTANNQITAFNPGAMRNPSTYSFPALTRDDIVIVSPSNLTDMLAIPRMCRERGVRYIFDPGQQIPALSGEQLLEAVTGSFMLITNDYELELIMKATGRSLADISKLTEYVITTLGENGSRVQMGDRVEQIAPAKASRCVDPTGAGDAYRSGLLKGLTLGLPVVEAARIGAVVAAFSVAEYGTQKHRFTLEECRARHAATFGVAF